MFFAKQNWRVLGTKISTFQKDEKFTDIDLLVDNEVFKGHKVILASASPYFETMFSTELCEKNKTTIEIHGLKRELFQTLFDYIYRRKLEINENNVQDILEGSNMLQLTSLTTLCCEFLDRKLDSKSVIGIYRLADLYSSTESILNLKRKCKFFIEQHFLNSIKSKEFLDLPFHLFENLLKSESLNIHNELDVFKITIHWILKDPDSRLKHLYSLMKHVRLPIIPEDKKESLIENVQHNEFKNILKQIVKQDLKKDNLNITEQNGIHSPNVDKEFDNLININLRWTPRYQNSCVFYLIGGLKKNSLARQMEVSTSIVRIDSFSFKITHLKRLSVARFNHESVEMNGLLYIAGGMDTAKMHFKLVETFDLYENKQKNRSYMLNARQDFGLINHNNHLLAIGGSTEFPSLIERYDPKTNKWSNFAEIPDLPVSGFRVVMIKNLIYIIGGTNKYDQLMNQTLCYDPETGEVKRLSDMNNSRASFGCTYAFGYIYVIGGCSSIRCKTTAERYSLENDQWTLISDLDRPLRYSCVTVAFNKLLIIGGEDSQGKPTNLIHSYDPERNIWKIFRDLPFEISRASLISLANLKV